MVLEENPFTLKIMAIPLSKDFKHLIIEVYDEVMDPFDHLQTFVYLKRFYAAQMW